jgi:transposase-like protein
LQSPRGSLAGCFLASSVCGLFKKQDAAAAKRFLAKALGGENHPTPRVINTDKHAAYPPAILQLKDEGVPRGELPTSTGAVPE